MTQKIHDKFLEYSNAELRIKLLTMENEYEALKSTIRKAMERMQQLSKDYSEMEQVLNKRTRGKGIHV